MLILSHLDQYKDVEALDIFRDFTERKGFSEKDTLELLGLKSRDNTRELRCSGIIRSMPGLQKELRGSE